MVTEATGEDGLSEEKMKALIQPCPNTESQEEQEEPAKKSEE